MDLIFNFINKDNEENKKFTDSKKDILKFLKIIGIDTRFISYYNSKIYINNLRFSKFSRKREKTFKKYFPQIEIIRSSLFQKICSKASRVLANSIEPNNVILLPSEKTPINELIAIILEPYSRKYGVKLVYEKNIKIDLIVDSTMLDEEVNSIFTTIFKGEGIDLYRNDSKNIYPLINVPKEWINSFLKLDNQTVAENKEYKDEFSEVADYFMNFLEDTAPQYKENVLKATEFIENRLKTK